MALAPLTVMPVPVVVITATVLLLTQPLVIPVTVKMDDEVGAYVAVGKDPPPLLQL